MKSRRPLHPPSVGRQNYRWQDRKWKASLGGHLLKLVSADSEEGRSGRAVGVGCRVAKGLLQLGTASRATSGWHRPGLAACLPGRTRRQLAMGTEGVITPSEYSGPGGEGSQEKADCTGGEGRTQPWWPL